MLQYDMASHIKNPATFYIVRHGQTDWNAVHKIQGQTDIPLNAIGEGQAEETRDLLQSIHFDAAFSSDLLRAKRTAEIITLERKIALKTTEFLRERNFGPLEGKQVMELRAFEEELEALADHDHFVHKFHPDWESDEELIGRFLTFLREVAVAYAEKTVLIVCHGGLMRTLLVHFGYVDYQTVRTLRILNTGYFTLFSDGVEFEVGETKDIYHEEITG
jgi:broad specificity phosphatase PhoE